MNLILEVDGYTAVSKDCNGLHIDEEHCVNETIPAKSSVCFCNTDLCNCNNDLCNSSTSILMNYVIFGTMAIFFFL